MVAKDIGKGTAELLSNQIYDKDLRGAGRGQDQIKHFLENVGDDTKTVKSDISTSKDARRAWDALQKTAPEAISKKEFKDGQTQYTVDMEKWRGKHSSPRHQPTKAAPVENHSTKMKRLGSIPASSKLKPLES